MTVKRIVELVVDEVLELLEELDLDELLDELREDELVEAEELVEDVVAPVEEVKELVEDDVE